MAKFVLKNDWRFEAPVIVRDPASGQAFDFVGVFQVLPAESQAPVLDAFVGWRGVGDERAANGELAVTDENRALLLKWPHVRNAIVRAYIAEIQKEPEKNAVPPAGAGPGAAPQSVN